MTNIQFMLLHIPKWSWQDLNYVQRTELGLRHVVDIVLVGLVVEFVRYPFLMGNIFLNCKPHQGFL